MRAKYVLIGAVLTLATVITPMVAFGGFADEGAVNWVKIADGRDFELNDQDTWRTLYVTTIQTDGPVNMITVTGNAYVQDHGPDGFRGKRYAAMRLRVLVDGQQARPGRMVFVSNAGVKRSSVPRYMSNSLEFFYETNGEVEILVQVKLDPQKNNDENFDKAGFKDWGISIWSNNPVQ